MAAGTRKKTAEAAHLMQAGRWEEALAAFQGILRKRPADVNALLGFAEANRRLGRIEESEKAFLKARQSNPHHPAVLLETGRRLINQKQFREAVRALQESIQRDPRNAEAHLELGRLYVALFQPERAVAVLRAGIENAPHNQALWRNLGDASQSLGKWREAVEAYQSALQPDDESVEHSAVLHYNLATALRAIGNFNKSETHYQHAAELDADLLEARAGLAELYESIGRFEEAQNIVGRFLVGDHSTENADDPEPRRRAVFGEVMTRIAKRTGDTKPTIQFLVEAVNETGLLPSQRAQLFFNLGALRERENQFDEAFAAYQSANELFPQSFDPDAYQKFIDDLINAFPVDAMQASPTSNGDSEQPIFIVGMPRSGTSLVEQILAAHPQVFAAGELELIPRLITTVNRFPEVEGSYPDCINALTPESLNALANEYLVETSGLARRHFARDGSGRPTERSADSVFTRITDKLPHNFLNLGLIARLFPNARIIHCKRDPADTCFSCYATSLSPLHSYANRLDHLAVAYREYERLMQHWEFGVIRSDRYLTIEYEKFVADPSTGARTLIKFVDLDWTDDCLRFFESDRVTLTASRDQVRQPIYSSSIGRAKRFADHLGPLFSSLQSP